MGIFKKNNNKVELASPVEENESIEEVKYVEDLSSNKLPEINQLPQPVPLVPVQPQVQQISQVPQQVESVTTINPKIETNVPEYREVPVCLSQAQINNLVIENNIMLKEIMSKD